MGKDLFGDWKVELIGEKVGKRGGSDENFVGEKG